MKITEKLWVLIFAMTISFPVVADNNDWLAELPKPWTIKADELAPILTEFHSRFPDYHERITAISMWRLGTPYEIFNLGEEQAPDEDPLFRLDVSDCTSHIITTISLANSFNWQQSRDNIIDVHYKVAPDGKSTPSYESRWHYTSDRLLNNPLTPNVTNQYVTDEQMKTISITLNKKADGNEFLDLDWTLPVDLKYIPSEQITPELLSSLPDLIGVAFVKEKFFAQGIVMAHEGTIIDGQYLLHAGQVAKETIKEDFISYYFTSEGPKFDGIMLYDFVPMRSVSAL